MANSARRVLRFRRFCLDIGRGSLRSGDEEIPLRPKSFDVLCYLTANAGRLVSKQELDDAVWPNVAVTDASLAQCIRELREKLEDTPRTLIRTVHRRGYILDAVVTEETVEVTAPIFPAPASIPDDRPLIETKSPSADWSASTTPGDRSQTGSESRKRWSPMMLTALAALALAVASGAAGLLHFSMQGPSGNDMGQALTMFRDCGECPEMVILPPRKLDKENGPEIGQRTNTIAVGRFEITVEQFAAFVDQSKFVAGSVCETITGSGKSVSMQTIAEASFQQQPDKLITNRHPATCVSWHDAKAYVAWLAGKTGKPYRLLTGAEWEYAARANTAEPYSFEGGVTRLCEYARFADLNSQFPWASSCHSSNPERGSLPVGSLKPNPWGLFDVHGNVWEWVDDCLSSDPAILPVMNAKSLPTDGCKIGVIRGGGWAANARRVDAGFHLDVQTRSRGQAMGFRVGLTIDRAP